MLRQGFLTLAQSKNLRNFAVRNPIARRLARRFVAGEELTEAVDVIAGLNKKGMLATFDHAATPILPCEISIAVASLEAVSEGEFSEQHAIPIMRGGLLHHAQSSPPYTHGIRLRSGIIAGSSLPAVRLRTSTWSDSS